MNEEIEKLGRKISDARQQSTIIKEPPEDKSAGGMRFGIELVSGVIGGALAGYFTDKYFGTSPVFFFIFFILGTLGGFLNIYRLASRQKTDINNDIKN